MMKQWPKLIFLVLLLNTACYVDEHVSDEYPEGEVEGWEPVYLTDSMEQILVLPAEDMEEPGKIYIYGSYLFVVDRGRGIHIINNSNPAEPNPVAFIQVLGATDIAVKGSVLYANQRQDLVVINMAAPGQPQVQQRVEGVFDLSEATQQYPPITSGYFVCPEPGQEVAYWRETRIESPKCRVQ